MSRNILIVDDDQELLLTAQVGLEKYADTFSVITAQDGQIAIEKLKQHPISLVVTDLKMPLMDGYSLLLEIVENYPEIHVIIMTGYGTAKVKNQVMAKGAVAFVEKPFLIEDLAQKIIAALQRESEGGTLHGFTTGIFAQLIEMEHKTCTLRVLDLQSETKGVLFFLDGVLMDARMNGLEGEEAAMAIFSWEKVSFSIQNTCLKTKKEIAWDLQGILLEAMRRKDDLDAMED